MRLNPNFIRYKWKFFWQCTIAGLFVFLVLVALGGFAHANILGLIGATSIGSSAFLMFAAHEACLAGVKRMVGGYVASIIIGVLMYWLAGFVNQLLPGHNPFYLHEYFAALALGAAMFFMLVLDFKHPPAAGLSLAFVTQDWQYRAIIVIFAAVLLLAILRYLLRKWMVSLT